MLQPYFNLYKIKYEIMTNLLRSTKKVDISSDDIINVYINMEPLLIKLSNPYNIDYIKTNSKNVVFEFISNTINLAAHYRWFFTKHKLVSRIYLCFPSFQSISFKNEAYNKDYRKFYKFKFLENINMEPFKNMVIDSIKYIKLITEYLQGIYFINSNEIEPSVIPYIIDKNHVGNNVNFLVTNLLYDFQYVNYGFNIMVPKKDDSVILNSYNVMDYIIDVYNCIGEYTIESELLPFILSIVGDQYRNIYNIKRIQMKSIKGMQMKSAIKMVQKALDEGIITNKFTNIHMFSQAIVSTAREQLISNYYLTDIKTQFNRLNKKDIFNIQSQIIDKLDNVSLKRINDKYFTEYPLMLVEVSTVP